MWNKNYIKLKFNFVELALIFNLHDTDVVIFTKNYMHMFHPIFRELQSFLSRVNMLQNVFSIGGQSKLVCFS